MSAVSVVLSHSIVRSLYLVVLMLSVPVGAGWSATVEVYYGPDDAPLDHLTTLYRHATRYLYVAVYGLTSPRAVEAMVAAKEDAFADFRPRTLTAGSLL